MKKLLTIILCFGLMFVLAACTETEVKPDMDKVNEVIEAIEALPTRATVDDEEEANFVVSMYDALSEEEKGLVSNKEALDEVLRRIDYYKNEASHVEKVVLDAKRYLEATIPTVIDYKTTKIELPAYYDGQTDYETYKINFYWSSSNSAIIDTTGNVMHDISDEKVTLTCRLSTRKLSNIEDFSVEVNVAHITFKSLSKGKVISGYLYSRYPGFTKSDLDTLDIVYICFGQIVERGGEFSIDISGINFLNSAKEIRNSGVRLVLSLGGWKDGEDAWTAYQNAASSEEGRKQVAQSILSTLKTNHLDGIDMDWEYPRSQDRSNYTLLMKEISETLKAVNSEYLVSAAIPAGTWLSSNYDLRSLNNYLDYFNVMSYDLDDGRNTSHMCALYSSTYASESADSALKYLAKNGVSKDKLIIGAAFYGRIFYDVKSTNNGLGQSYSSKKSITYKEIKESYLNRVGRDVTRYYDSTAHAYYLYDATNKVFISYDEVDAVKEKCDYVISNGYGGIMYWSYTDDLSGTLMNALDDKLADMKK